MTEIGDPGEPGPITSTSVEPAVPAVPGTPSWLTGEFYAALAPFAAGLITVASGRHVVPAQVQDWLVGAGTVVIGVYALARTLLKVMHVHAAAVVARAQAITRAQAIAATPRVETAVDVDAIAAAVTAQLDSAFVRRRAQPRKKTARGS
jgi:hypothetical protein